MGSTEKVVTINHRQRTTTLPLYDKSTNNFAVNIRLVGWLVRV